MRYEITSIKGIVNKLNNIFNSTIGKLLLFVICFIIFFSTIGLYITRSYYYGTVKIITENNNVLVKAESPFYTNLTFNKKDNVIEYQHSRFYNKITYEKLSDTTSDSIILILNGSEYRTIINDDTEKNLLTLYNNNNPLQQRISDLTTFILKTHHKHLQILVIINILILIIILSTKAPYILKITTQTIYNNRNKVAIIFAVTLVIIFALIYRVQLNNEVVIINNQDQHIYQTCAVNYINGYGFLTGGIINDTIDYKLNIKNIDYKENLIAYSGIKRYDRFPGYVVFLTLTYQLFGNNPVIVKYIQLLLLTITLIILIIFSDKAFSKKGYFAALISSPFICQYLIEYTYMFSPDIISIFFNIIIIKYYWSIKKHYNTTSLLTLGIIAGVSFLFKASLNIFMAFVIIDLFYYAYNTKSKRKLYFIFLFSFVSCWLPYNLYSVHKSIETQKHTTILLNEINKPRTNITHINSIFNNNNGRYGIFPHKAEIKPREVAKYKNQIKPKLKKHGYLENKEILTLSKNERMLYFIELNANTSPWYFMIKLYPMHGLMDFNNEFITKEGLNSDWKDNETSFYNNDNLQNRSQIIRVLNFYMHNPEQILKITHSKLSGYFSNSLILFCISIVFFILYFYYFLKTKPWQENKSRPILMISTALVLGVSILNFTYFYVFLFMLISTLIYDENFLELRNNALYAIFINMFFFALLTFGNSRYLIYYDTVFFVILFYLTIKLLDQILINKKTT